MRPGPIRSSEERGVGGGPLEVAPVPRFYARPSDDPEVVGVLKELAASHVGLIDPVSVAGDLDTKVPDCGGIQIAALLKQRRPLAAAALAGAILDLMTGRPDRAWLKPQTALRMALGFYQRTPGNRQMLYAAKGVVWSLERWIVRAEPPVEFDSDAAQRWSLISELRRLPEAFPAPLLDAVVVAIGENAVSGAWPAFEAFKLESPEAAAEAHGALRGHTELLEAALGRALPAPPARMARPPRSMYMASADDPVGPTTADRLLVVSKQAIGAVTRTAKVTRNYGRTVPTVLAVIFLLLGASLAVNTSSDTDDLTADIGPGDDQLLLAKVDLCNYLGQDRPGCIYTRLLVRGIVRNDCVVMTDSLRKLDREAARHGDLNAGMLGDAHAGIDARSSLDYLTARVEVACLH